MKPKRRSKTKATNLFHSSCVENSSDKDAVASSCESSCSHCFSCSRSKVSGGGRTIRDVNNLKFRAQNGRDSSSRFLKKRVETLESGNKLCSGVQKILLTSSFSGRFRPRSTQVKLQVSSSSFRQLRASHTGLSRNFCAVGNFAPSDAIIHHL